MSELIENASEGEPIDTSKATSTEPVAAPSEPPNVAAIEPNPVEAPPIEPAPVEPTPVAPTPAAPTPVTPTPVAPTPTKETTSTSEPKPAAKPKTAVTLAASGYPWVKIRIGSATYVLDRKSSPSKKISLKPGPHTIAFQIDEEEPWQELGKVTIPAQPTARLELQKPGKVVIE